MLQAGQSRWLPSPAAIVFGFAFRERNAPCRSPVATPPRGRDPFAAFTFVPRTSRIVNPGRDGRLRDEGPAGPGALVAGGRRHPGPEVLPQGRRAARRPSAWPKRACRSGCSAAGRPRATRAPARRPTPARSSAGWPAAGPTGAGRAATSPPRPTPRPSSTRPATCWRRRWRRPNSPQWFNTGLHWAYGIEGPPQGHYYVDPADRRDDAVDVGLRTRQRRTPASSSRSTTTWSTKAASWTCGSARPASSNTARGTGTQFLRLARRRRAAVRRRQVERPDELPQDRRPRRRRHQVGRHHAPRRQDGRPRSRSSRHRGVRQLEGGRGAEGRRPGDRLASCSTGI